MREMTKEQIEAELKALPKNASYGIWNYGETYFVIVTYFARGWMDKTEICKCRKLLRSFKPVSWKEQFTLKYIGDKGHLMCFAKSTNKEWRLHISK